MSFPKRDRRAITREDWTAAAPRTDSAKGDPEGTGIKVGSSQASQTPIDRALVDL